MTQIALQQECARLSTNVEQVENAISALSGGAVFTRSLSPAVRARIAATQRARWGKVKKQKVVPSASRKLTGHKPRKLWAGAIAKIRAAQKLRWARWREAQKSWFASGFTQPARSFTLAGPMIVPSVDK